MCFPGSEIQKKCFGGDRCVSRNDKIVIYMETKKMIKKKVFSRGWAKSLKYSIPLTKILLVIL